MNGNVNKWIILKIMNEKIDKNIDNKKNTSELLALDNINNLKKEVENWNWIIKLLKNFEKSPLFENVTFKKWDYIFKEWDIDNNIYIIKKWVLSVEKFTTNLKDTSKQLAILKAWDFAWEWAISKSDQTKEASIKALEKTEVLKIDAKNELKKYIEENPVYWYELLKIIILETNKRLLEANKLIASNYEIEKTINSLKTIDLKSIFWLIDRIKNILDVDYILYIEKHPILENFLQLKYDSRQPNKLLDKIFEKDWIILDLEDIFEWCNVSPDDQVIVNKIFIWDEVYWYLIIWRYKKVFDGSDKKVFSSMTNSLAWILKKFLSDKENKDKFYISESKKY